MVRMRMRLAGRALWMRRAASRPFRRGIEMSRTTTSGFISSALSTASLPSAASATTSNSPAAFKMLTRP
jgi:hypothetical protein